MSKDLYSDYKKLLIEQNFKTKNYSKIFDEYFRVLKCQAKNCNEGKIFKKIFFHLLAKHKKLLSLKKQNDELFFQILHDIKSPALAINTVLENSERNFLDDEIYRINQSMLLLIKNFLFIYSFESGYTVLYIFDGGVSLDVGINFVVDGCVLQDLGHLAGDAETDQIRIGADKGFPEASGFGFGSNLADGACAMIRGFIEHDSVGHFHQSPFHTAVCQFRRVRFRPFMFIF